MATMQRLLSDRFLQSVAALLGLLTLTGVLIWLAERRRRDHYSWAS